MANPFGGESQMTRRRIDLNGNGIILTNQHDGNVPYQYPYQVTESAKSFFLNGAPEDGAFGPDAAFNIVGQKMGNSYNPAIFEQQHYDLATAWLTPIKLGGLSVKLIARDAATGAITVKVRYDDVNIEQDTRWSGDLLLQNILAATAANGADVHVTSGKTLTINKSGTNNRHTLLNGAFINPTKFICAAGSYFLQDGGSTVSLEGSNTAFQVSNGASVYLSPYGSAFVVKSGAVLDIQNGASFTARYATSIRVEAGGSLVVHNGATLLGEGQIEVQNGGYLCIESGAILPTSRYFTLNVAPNAIIGTNPNLSIGLGTLNCSSQLQFCGRLIGGNSVLSALCPSENEALLFDGIDDVVTIPRDPSLGSAAAIHNIYKAFAIEATIRCDRPASGGNSQTIFSNRDNTSSQGTGLLFAIYDDQYLLLQIDGQNYFNLTDPDMRIVPGSGCHQVAVVRDRSDVLHFYIDGKPANYMPTASGNPYSPGNVRIGGDAPFASTNESFEGQIGEVRFWGDERTDADILSYYTAALETPQNNLLAYYDMRDPDGQLLADISGFANSGTIVPNGFLGTTDTRDANDPTWVLGKDVTCSVKGNFRQQARTPGKALPDTVGQATRRMLGTSQTASGTHLSQLTISPNPTSGEAVMHFQLRDAGKVEISIQDITGYTRATALPATTLDAGTHDVKLPLHGLSPGVYLVIVTSADGRKVIRLEIR